MPLRHLTRNRLGISVILAGLACEAAASVPSVVLGMAWIGGEFAFVVHVLSSILIGAGAASFLTSRQHPGQAIGAAVFFVLLALTIPVAGIIAVLLLATILLSHRTQPHDRKTALTRISGPAEPAPQSPEIITAPLVALAAGLTPVQLREVALGMQEMPAGQVRPLLEKLQKHPDVQVQLHANGLINDQTDAAECRLETLGKRSRQTPGDLPTLVAIVESHLRSIDEHLIPDDEIPHTAQQAVHAAELALATDPRNAVALRAKVRFQLLLEDLHGAYGTILHLHQIDGQQSAANGLLARLSYEHAAHQPVAATPSPSRSRSRAPARQS